jgi:CRISPR-associated protein Cmr1
MGFAGSRYVFGVSLATPMIVGWFEPGQLDPLGVRATEVKGLWRWWARTFVAGAMYDLGLFEGDSRGDAVLRPSIDDVKRVNHIIGSVMGLGIAGESGAEASRFTIYAEYAGRASLQPRCSSDGLQRVRFLSLGKKRVCYHERGTRFSIVVEKRRNVDPYAELAAVKILAVALQLSGLGNGGRRGLGSLDVSLPPDLRYRDLKQLISDAYEFTLEIVRSTASKKSWSTRRRADAPPIPAVSKSSFKDLPVARIMIANVRDFPAIHNFFVRSERCRVLAGSPICDDDLRKTLNAWILGLPRGREKPSPTGYTIDVKRISRRASPILVAYHTTANSFGYGAYISILFSADWPKEIEWFGAGVQTINVDLDRLYNAYKVAVSELQSYLQKVDAQVTHVWP